MLEVIVIAPALFILMVTVVQKFVIVITELSVTQWTGPVFVLQGTLAITVVKRALLESMGTSASTIVIVTMERNATALQENVIVISYKSDLAVRTVIMATD